MAPTLASPLPSLAEADRLLEGLDQLAQSSVSEGEFWRQFLTVAQRMTGASGVAILYPARENWVAVAQCGEVPSGSIATAGEGADSQGSWISAMVEPSRPGCGSLWIGFRQEESARLLDSGRLLMEPFCEILRARQAMTIMKRSGEWSSLVEGSLRSITGSGSSEALRQSLVDQLVLAIEGVRVSLVSRVPGPPGTFRLLCSSGTTSVDRMSPTVKRLEQLAELASRQDGLYRWNGPAGRDPSSGEQESHSAEQDSFGVFVHGLAFSWDRGAECSVPTWLVVEWADITSMNNGIPFLSSWCNPIYPVWLQQSRWTRLSPRVQQRLSRPAHPWWYHLRVWFRRGIGLAFFGGVLWGMTLPVPMTIESKGTLEPVSRRLIHASSDGFIEELLVEDGDRVVAQQELARLRSPSLDLQIEEVMGQLRAIAEKRNGLKVAINQLSPNATDALANQTRLSTELVILDSSESHAREMLAFYQAEQSRLVIRSPIDGVVVARRLRQELENRPIRRGDPLLQVVDLSGDWQLSVEVADRDSDYVNRFYGERSRAGRGQATPSNAVEYTFDSLPSDSFAANVTDIARVIENREGLGGFQEVLASVAREDAARVHMGATARVRFACGREPFAFVWSRPLVEFLQKRFRFLSWSQTSFPSTTSDSL